MLALELLIQKYSRFPNFKEKSPFFFKANLIFKFYYMAVRLNHQFVRLFYNKTTDEQHIEYCNDDCNEIKKAFCKQLVGMFAHHLFRRCEAYLKKNSDG